MDIDLTRLRHLTTVARTGSFTRAAEELHITQPALSRSIATLEAGVGLRLFDRGRGGVHATAAGRQAIAQAEEVLRNARSLDLNLKLLARGEGGQVAIGFGPLLASLLLPTLARQLVATTPRLELRTSIRPPHQLVDELLDDRIELIFGNSWSIDRNPELVAEPFGRVALAIVVRGGHPLASRGEITIADAREFPVASSSGVPGAGLDGAAGGIYCDNSHILRELVPDTDCVWVASPAFVAQELADGRLVQLRIAGFAAAASEIVLLRRAGRTVSPAAQSVATQMRVILEEMDKPSAGGELDRTS